MKLDDYINRKIVNSAKLSKLIGYSPIYTAAIFSGKIKPGKKFLKAIENISVAEVMYTQEERKRIMGRYKNKQS
jgi:hypothetical protein